MELAKITAKGQITIPLMVRRALGVKEGDKVVFWNDGNRIIIENSTRLALEEVQEAFEGVAEELGLKDEQDVAELIKQLRREERYENK